MKRLNREWFPELDLFPTPEAKAEVERRFVWTSTGRGFWFGFLSFAYVGIGRLIGTRLAELADPRGQLLYYTVNICSFVLVVLSGGIGGVWFYRGHVRRQLRRELNRRGIVVCINCGYDLRGQIEQRCPECGEPFKHPKAPSS